MHDLGHLEQRRRHHRAAGFARVEEGLLVHFLRFVRVADEDDVDVLVAALEEQVEQRIEALGQILHVLVHRAGDVHQAEHHRLGDRLGRRFEAPIAHVDRIDVGNALGARAGAVRARRAASPVRRNGRPRVRASRSRSRSAWISSGFGRFSAMRRDSEWRIVRDTEMRAGGPAVEKPAWRHCTDCAPATWRLARSGSSRSSRKRSRYSSSDSAKRNSSSPSPLSLALDLARRPAPDAGWCRLRRTSCCRAARSRACRLGWSGAGAARARRRREW